MSPILPYTLDWFRIDGSRVPSGTTPPLYSVMVSTVQSQAVRGAAVPVSNVRRQYPWVPLVLVVPGLNSAQMTEVALFMRRTAARVLGTSLGDFAAWRERLLDDSDFVDNFASMLELQRPDLERETLQLVERLVSAGATGVPFEATIESSRIGQRALESRLRRSSLAPPNTYYRFGGLAVAIIALAANPEMTIAWAAQLSSYDNRATFTRAVREQLATTPSAARRTIPWEWIAFRMNLYRRSVP